MGKKYYKDLFLITIIATAARIHSLLAIRPSWVGDSGGYTTTWLNFYYGHLINIDGGRTPFYPLFLGVTQWLSGYEPTLTQLSVETSELICLLQGIISILVPLAIYDILINKTDRKVSLVTSIFISVFYPIVTLDREILPASLESSFLILFVWSLFRDWKHRRDSLTTGIIAIVLVFTRPDSLIFVTIVFFGYLIFFRLKNRNFIKIAKPLVPFLILLLAWMSFLYLNTGYFKITTYDGLVRASSVGDMFDQVDDNDKLIGTIIHNKYLEVKSSGIYWPDYITGAWPDIIKNYKNMPIVEREPWHLGHDLSSYIGTVSLRLIKKNPVGWLRNSCNSFLNTFRFDNLVYSENTNSGIKDLSISRNHLAFSTFNFIYNVEIHLLFIFYLFFTFIVVLFATLFFFYLKFPRRLHCLNLLYKSVDGFSLVLTSAYYCTLLGFCMLTCYLPRYGMPYQNVMFLLVGFFGYSIMKSTHGVSTRTVLVQRE